MSTSPLKLSVVVVGAGIGGLAVALSLAKKGHHVRVLERQEQLSTNGGPVILPPSATRILADLGVLKDLQKITHEIPSQTIRRYNNSELIQRRSLSLSSFPVLGCLRPDIQQTLFDHATNAGVEISFNHNVNTIDESGPSVTTKNGTIFRGDLVVAADGVRSNIRTMILPITDTNPVVSTEKVFTLDLRGADMESDQDLSRLYHNPELTLWVGPGRGVLSIPIPKKGMFLATFVHHSPTGIDSDGIWVKAGDLQFLRSKFGKFDPITLKLLDKAQSCTKWNTATGAPLKGWTSKSGKVVLLGDAAHAMVPDAGQGASQCIEDSAALAEFLSQASSPSDIPSLTNLYCNFRKPRTERMQKLSTVNSDAWKFSDGPKQRRRDRTFKQRSEQPKAPARRTAVKPDPDAPFRSLAFNLWLAEYDTVREAREFLKRQSGVVKVSSRL